MIVSDNGTELTSRAVLDWMNRTGIDWHCIAPGNRSRTHLSRASVRFRDECLNEEIFGSVAEGRAVIENWRATSTPPGRTPLMVD